MQKIQVKKIKANEIINIQCMIDELGNYHNQLSGLNDFYPIISSFDTVQNIKSAMSSKSTFVLGAFCEKEIVGFIHYSIHNKIGLIERLYVNSNNRHHGIGTKLMDTALADLRSSHLDHIDINVLIENTAAQSFYEKYGFKPRLTTMTKTN